MLTLPPAGRVPPGTVTFTSPPGVLTVAPPDVTVCWVDVETLTRLEPLRLLAVAVMRVTPVAMPVTTPAGETGAIAASLVLHWMPEPLTACPDALTGRAVRFVV